MEQILAIPSSKSNSNSSNQIGLRNQRAVPTNASVIPFSKKSEDIATNLVVTHTKDWWSIATEFLLIGGSLAALAYMLRQLMKQQDPENTQKQVAEHIKHKLIKAMKKYGRNVNMFATSPYEDTLLDMIILPEQIGVRFNDIGGLDSVKRDLTETVLVPLMCPQLAGSSRLCQPPLGVLFYGCPGTGKSMVAKAVACESRATFINVDMSRLMSKWYGDSQKYIAALFSLARKMAPTIIWIDEIDALFSQRSHSDHSADIYNKALFLSLWDGLANNMDTAKPYSNKLNDTHNYIGHAQVMILGATNRPQEVDEAFLRRMSRQYEFEMPDEKTRRLILQILLQTEHCDKTVDIGLISKKTSQYSGSDLKEVCKYAATMPLREYLRKNVYSNSTTTTQSDDGESSIYNDNIMGRTMTPIEPKRHNDNGINTPTSDPYASMLHSLHHRNSNELKLRPINMNDFDIALKHVQSTTKAHLNYKKQFNPISLLNNLGHSTANFYNGFTNNNNNNNHFNNNHNNSSADNGEDL